MKVSKNITPRVTLVGAGPGDPELLTIKAVKAIQTADLVLYDALVSDEILAWIPTGIPSFSVGKRARAHTFSQEEINRLIVELAVQHGHVVRLKGGDPFIFGRGYEELDYARRHGIETQVVPGLSSALTVPANVGIPLTLRGVSESFWVVTGTTKEGKMSEDIAWAARSTATVVILMGMEKLGAIMDEFSRHGKSDTPVSIIERGTTPEERVVTATVGTMAKVAATEGIAAPAIIVVGETAAKARESSRELSTPWVYSAQG